MYHRCAGLPAAVSRLRSSKSNAGNEAAFEFG
jgi:hypothetical protein